MRVPSKFLCAFGVLPAIFAMGSVDRISAQSWGIQGMARRNMLVAKKRDAEFRAAHPELTIADLKEANKVVADRNPDKISIVERGALKDGVTVSRTISVDASSWHSEPPMTFLDSTDYAKVPKTLADIPEDRLDIGRAELALEKEFWPDLDVESYSRQLDEMAEEIRRMTRGSTEPEIRIGTMNTYLFKIRDFRYNGADPTGKKVETRTLRGILDSHMGNCYSMPLLYHALAQRLGYPIKAVHVPRHGFLRYDDPVLKKQNIEVTAYGSYESDESFIGDMKITEKSRKNGVYLRTLSNREYLAMLISHAAAYWQGNKWKISGPSERLKNVFRALQYLAIAERLNPKNDMVVVSTAYAYLRLQILEQQVGKELAAKSPEFVLENKLRTRTSSFYFARANWLGVNPRDYSDEYEREYLEKVAKIQKNHEEAERGFAEERQKLIEAWQRKPASRRPL